METQAKCKAVWEQNSNARHYGNIEVKFPTETGRKGGRRGCLEKQLFRSNLKRSVAIIQADRIGRTLPGDRVKETYWLLTTTAGQRPEGSKTKVNCKAKCRKARGLEDSPHA